MCHACSVTSPFLPRQGLAFETEMAYQGGNSYVPPHLRGLGSAPPPQGGMGGYGAPMGGYPGGPPPGPPGGYDGMGGGGYSDRPHSGKLAYRQN